MSEKRPEKSHHKRGSGTQAISDLARQVSRGSFRRYGFAQSEIIARWPEIVGPVLSGCSVPERLTFPRAEGAGGTLYIRIEGSFAAEMQHLEELVLERINGFYGYRAVERLVYRHGPLPRRGEARARQAPELSDSQKKELEDLLLPVKDKTLQKALFQLGATVMVPEKPEKPTPRRRFTRRGMGAAMPDKAR
ncbi:DUF721 domain-containing protein [Emcibacter nanhaiensis]|uniref:DUF721 domain-containing protein n=1 Tax=Emcibacter nanhaiensis TaxID=1505037 RepID=A0A501PCC7_9PROT|nr:DciA family protein [Emcibacter nanhaiensis]TPD57657.1 DUF721 domain-containing protein [Emcibacter nanhaiensis]